MAVQIGSARIDERGKISGGAAGNQTGKELSTQNWYLHSKGWRVLRPKDYAKAQKMAECMEMACKNMNIGYDQVQRNTLYNEAKQYGFDVSKVTKKVETDCSALVRVCCAYAGIMVDNFNTSSEASRLLSSGEFIEYTESDFTKKSDYLRKGDVLVTKTKGHTVIVLTNGPKAGSGVIADPTYVLGQRILKNGMEGNDVKELQSLLIQAGYSCGSYGADGEFGDATENAVRELQKDSKITVDGEAGPQTLAALEKLLEDTIVNAPKSVKIVNGNCFVRKGANTSYSWIKIARRGEIYSYAGETTDNGWNKIYVNETTVGWVSGKYSELV